MQSDLPPVAILATSRQSVGAWVSLTRSSTPGSTGADVHALSSQRMYQLSVFLVYRWCAGFCLNDFTKFVTGKVTTHVPASSPFSSV